MSVTLKQNILSWAGFLCKYFAFPQSQKSLPGDPMLGQILLGQVAQRHFWEGKHSSSPALAKAHTNVGVQGKNPLTCPSICSPSNGLGSSGAASPYLLPS